jgi:hypothetical protein
MGQADQPAIMLGATTHVRSAEQELPWLIRKELALRWRANQPGRL